MTKYTNRHTNTKNKTQILSFGQKAEGSLIVVLRRPETYLMFCRGFKITDLVTCFIVEDKQVDGVTVVVRWTHKD